MGEMVERMKVMEAELMKMVKEREEEKKAVEKKMEVAEEEKEELKKKMKEIKKARKEGHHNVILHMKCVAGRIVDRSVEDPDNFETSVVCFSDESAQAHCHHVLLSGQD